MLSNGISNPVILIAGLENQNFSSRFRESIHISHLDLQQGQIFQDLQVVLRITIRHLQFPKFLEKHLPRQFSRH
jgi:hypothetical protein